MGPHLSCSQSSSSLVFQPCLPNAHCSIDSAVVRACPPAPRLAGNRASPPPATAVALDRASLPWPPPSHLTALLFPGHRRRACSHHRCARLRLLAPDAPPRRRRISLPAPDGSSLPPTTVVTPDRSSLTPVTAAAPKHGILAASHPPHRRCLTVSSATPHTRNGRTRRPSGTNPSARYGGTELSRILGEYSLWGRVIFRLGMDPSLLDLEPNTGKRGIVRSHPISSPEPNTRLDPR